MLAEIDNSIPTLSELPFTMFSSESKKSNEVNCNILFEFVRAWIE